MSDCKSCMIDSPWRTLISQAILKLQEDGKLQELKDRWWIEKNGGADHCGSGDEEGGDTPEVIIHSIRTFF